MANLTAVISVANKASGPLKAINSDLRRMQQPIKSLSGQFKALGRVSGFSALRSGIGGVASEMAKLSAIGAGLAGGGFYAIKKMAETGDEIIKTATNFDFATDKLQEYRFIAERSGVSSAALNKSIQAFTKRMAEARNGTGELYGLLDKVNPAFLQQLLAINDNAEAYEFMLKSMSKLPTQQRQILLGDKAFSEAGRELVKITALGADEIENLRKQAHQYGAVLDRSVLEQSATFQDNMTNISSVVKGVAFSIGGALMPEINNLVAGLTGWYQANKAVIDQNVSAFAKQAAGNIKTFTAKMGEFLPKAGAFIESIGGMKTIAIGMAAVIAGPLLSAIVTLSTALLTTPLGWIALAIGGVILAVKGWIEIFKLIKPAMEPIFNWFSNAWQKITDFIQQGAALIKPLLDGMNAIGGAFGGSFASRESSTGRSVNAGQRSPVLPRQQADVGGEIKVSIDSEGRPSVKNVRSRNRGVNLVADVGYSMAAAS